MITETLKDLIATYIASIPAATDNSEYKVGLGGNSTSPESTTLDVPITTTPSVVSAVVDGNVIEFQAIFQGSDANMTGNVIREFGIFDGSNLIARHNFQGVGPFSSTEDLEIFFTIEVE